MSDVLEAKGPFSLGTESRGPKSANDLAKIKNGVIRDVIATTLSESEDSERFHFLPIPLMTPSLVIQ